jgi:hypothetical protein
MSLRRSLRGDLLLSQSELNNQQIVFNEQQFFRTEGSTVLQKLRYLDAAATKTG